MSGALMNIGVIAILGATLFLATLIIWPDIRDDIRRDMTKPRWLQRQIIAGVVLFICFMMLQLPGVRFFTDQIFRPKLVLLVIAVATAYIGWRRGRAEGKVTRWVFALIFVASVVGILITS
jgi:hypothetical protein